MEYDLAIIGGGAAGLAAATVACAHGDRVAVLESSSQIGRKILSAGNGRCNLMNSGKPRYYGNAVFAESVLARCGEREQRQFWSDLGLILEEDPEKRIYPCTYQGSTVLDALKDALQQGNADIRLNTHVITCIPDQGKGFRIQTENGQIDANRLLVSTGGPAGKKSVTVPDGYDILRSFGHSIHPVRPALVPLTADRKSISGLSGIRARGKVTLKDRQGETIHQEHGEILFTDYGVSGICVMQCARFVKGTGYTLELDMAERYFSNDTEMEEELKRRKNQFRHMTPDTMIRGILPAKAAFAVMKQAGVPMKGEKLEDLGEEIIPHVIRAMRGYRIRITGTRSIEDAQVTAGGADCDEFASGNMESKIMPGLFAAGEVLDTDGDCGGFNLMFAFGSGILAGLNGRPYTIPYGMERR